MIDSHFATWSNSGSGYIPTLLPVLKSMGNMFRTATGARAKTIGGNGKKREGARVKV